MNISFVRGMLRCLKTDRKGFTLIEFVVVLIIIGITATIAVNRLTLTPRQAADIAAVDQAVADIRYAQLRALALRTQQSIVFAANSSQYTVAGETKHFYDASAVGSSATFIFNSFGERTAGSSSTVAIGGRTIQVVQTTGKVSIQ